MRILTLTTALFLAFLTQTTAQCDLTGLSVITAPGQVLTANAECTDPDGWTHYYHNTSNRILLSIKKNGQDISSVGLGLTVTAGTLPTYGTGGFNLSGADYIDNEIWIVANRYWQITGANAITDSLKVRFYLSAVDVSDIAATVDDFGFFVDQPEDLYMFTIGNGGGLYPLATSTQPASASYTLYDMFPGDQPDWSSGSFNGFPYGEFWVKTLDIGGGAGFLIFQSSPLLTISGNIARPGTGTPVPSVDVQAASISFDVTNAAGNYSCGSLLSGSDYQIVPHKDTDHAEGISVVDLIAVAMHINGSQPITNPYRYIAADASHDTLLTFFDITQIRNVLLGNAPNFPNNTSWRFVPKGYAFPVPSHPFTPQFPETIAAPNLQDSLSGQDFFGVKIGDVADPSTAPPPPLNTTFSLPSLNACNPGDTLTFDLKVQDFQNVRGFQFTLEWDPSVMQFLNVSNFNLTNFTANSVGDDAAASGILTFAWAATTSPNGATAPNGATICKLRFKAGGSTGSSTPLSFTSSATDLLLIHQNLSQVVPGTVAGSFVLDNNSTISAIGIVQSTDCAGQPNGAIDLYATGGNGTLSYIWSNGATTQDVFGLAAGPYSVTINDASGNCPLVQFYEVNLPAPMTVNATVFDMACPFVASGAIDLDVLGGEAPLHYHWSDGSAGGFNDDLFAGNYSVTVTDDAGCTATANFTVEPADQVTLVVAVTNASNPGASDGAISLSAISGSTGPFTFLWSNGAATQSLTGIPPGDYVVTITDGLGCQHVFGWEVFGLFTGTVEADGSLASLGVFPNPVLAGSEVSLVFSSKNAGMATATVVSTDGKVVGRSEFKLPQGESTQPLGVPTTSGLYIIFVEMDGLPAGRLKLVVR